MSRPLCEQWGEKSTKQWQDYRAIVIALFLQEALGWEIENAD